MARAKRLRMDETLAWRKARFRVEQNRLWRVRFLLALVVTKISVSFTLSLASATLGASSPRSTACLMISCVRQPKACGSLEKWPVLQGRWVLRKRPDENAGLPLLEFLIG